MKIRSGFVSNSSSSSFVLDIGILFKSPIEIAYHMIMERDWPNDGELLDNLTKMVRNGKVVDQTNLSFHSVNYDTYIYNTNKSRIAIYTNNNTDWKLPASIKWCFKDDKFTGYYGVSNKKFTLIETGFEGIRLSDDQTLEISSELSVSSFDLWCNSCHKEMWLVEGKTQNFIACPVCSKRFCIKDLTISPSKWEKV